MGTLITPHGEAIVEEDDLNQNRETNSTPPSWYPTTQSSDGWLGTGKENLSQKLYTFCDNNYNLHGLTMKQKDMKRVKTKIDHGNKMTMQELVCDGVVANTVPMMRVTGTTVIDGVKYKTLTF